TLQPLCEQARPLTVMPDHFQKIAAAAAEAEQVTAQRIAPQYLLHLQRQARKTLPHVGVPGCQPHPHVTRHRDHGRSSTARTRASTTGSTPLSTITLCPCTNTISIRPGAIVG